MAYLIEVAHTKHRFLSSLNNIIVVHRIDPTYIQTWRIDDSEEDPFKFIRSTNNNALYLVSPNIHGNQAFIVPFGALQDIDLAKWRLSNVHEVYDTEHAGANEHDACLFIQPKLMPDHELGVNRESTHNDATVILWNHQGIQVAEPRNQMWLLKATINQQAA